MKDRHLERWEQNGVHRIKRHYKKQELSLASSLLPCVRLHNSAGVCAFMCMSSVCAALG